MINVEEPYSTSSLGLSSSSHPFVQYDEDRTQQDPTGRDQDTLLQDSLSPPQLEGSGF